MRKPKPRGVFDVFPSFLESLEDQTGHPCVFSLVIKNTLSKVTCRREGFIWLTVQVPIYHCGKSGQESNTGARRQELWRNTSCRLTLIHAF